MAFPHVTIDSSAFVISIDTQIHIQITWNKFSFGGDYIFSLYLKYLMNTFETVSDWIKHFYCYAKINGVSTNFMDFRVAEHTCYSILYNFYSKSKSFFCYKINNIPTSWSASTIVSTKFDGPHQGFRLAHVYLTLAVGNWPMCKVETILGLLSLLDTHIQPCLFPLW